MGVEIPIDRRNKQTNGVKSMPDEDRSDLVMFYTKFNIKAEIQLLETLYRYRS